MGEDAEFSFDVKEPEYISFDKATNTVTGVKVGETTVGHINHFCSVYY